MKGNAPISSWGVLLGVFLGLGLAGLDDRPELRSPAARGEWATTDYSLEVALHQRVKSEAVRDALATLPDDGDILFAGPSDDPNFKLTFYLMSYLGWPRKVWAVRCAEAGEPLRWEVEPRDILAFEGVVLYRIPPPTWAPDGVAIGSNLTVIRTQELLDWYLYCP